MADSMVKFKHGTYENYVALSNKESDTLYFITDVGNARLYKGDQLLTQQWEVTPGLPEITNAKTDRLYIDTVGNKIAYKNEDGVWSNVLEGSKAEIGTKVTETGEGVVSSAAIYEFVKSEIGVITGDEEAVGALVKEVAVGDAAGTLVIAHGAKNETVTLKNLVHTPTWDAEKRILTLPNTTNETLTINFGKDMVVSDGVYNAVTQELELTIANSDKIVKIPVADLVNIYTASADETGAVKITVENNTIKGSVLVAENGILKIVNGKLTADLTDYINTTAFDTLEARVEAIEEDIDTLEIDLEAIQDYINGTGDGTLTAKVNSLIKPTADEVGTLKQTVANMDAAYKSADVTTLNNAKAYTDTQVALAKVIWTQIGV